ncbi:GAF domain-containing protein [Streptomyces sp. JJ38]|uniref:GAF domain-containing protein n=1 Tax=Streptomyces sp. JJ38 TaxID=2738128 RepID=UPI001C561EDB|nr:GAF domain-containing protein [Streptomyces sp. JJ38]MBW1595503.1 GAF domain-containing protein [Streptomyces sp. JJ38]
MTAATPPEAIADPLSRELLQSVVEVARAIFGAQASSLLLHDEHDDALVFQAVSGEGENHLVGRRFPTGRGIAGWVLSSGEAMVVDDLARNATFDRELAESTEFVPDTIMAAPLCHGDRVLGVLEVLDPVPQSRSSLGELDLLALFAHQAATALRVVQERRVGVTHPGWDRAAALDLVHSLMDCLESGAPAS